jgi:hypothetical protein
MPFGLGFPEFTGFTPPVARWRDSFTNLVQKWICRMGLLIYGIAPEIFLLINVVDNSRFSLLDPRISALHS